MTQFYGYGGKLFTVSNVEDAHVVICCSTPQSGESGVKKDGSQVSRIPLRVANGVQQVALHSHS